MLLNGVVGFCAWSLESKALCLVVLVWLAQSEGELHLTEVVAL